MFRVAAIVGWVILAAEALVIGFFLFVGWLNSRLHR
jgi:hypothetical protein